VRDEQRHVALREERQPAAPAPAEPRHARLPEEQQHWHSHARAHWRVERRSHEPLQPWGELPRLSDALLLP
jgi:hypothetical protein